MWRRTLLSLVALAPAFDLRPSAPQTSARLAAADAPAAAGVLAALGPSHDIHLTYSRVVVDGKTILFRVRLFRDDLEKALKGRSGDPEMAANRPAADSLFAAYFNATVPVMADGRRLSARVVQSGRDADATDWEMWWYLVELTSPTPVTSLAMRVGLLFEHFGDQKNLVTLLEMPGEKRHSLYFVGQDSELQSIRLR